MSPDENMENHRMEEEQSAIVVVESHFGNTVAVADSIAAALRAAGIQTALWLAHDAQLVIPPDTTLVLLAAPSHDGALSTPISRKTAAGLGAKDSTDTFGMRDWIERTSGGRDRRLIAIGTAPKAEVEEGVGSGVRETIDLAVHHGFSWVEEGPTFGVLGVAGPLAPGELRRAREWAVQLVEEVAGPAMVTQATRAESHDNGPTHEGVEVRSAVELARLIAAGDLSSEEVVEQCIERLSARTDLNLLAFDRFDEARSESRAARSGPFAGVPLLLKDLGCDIAGTRYSMGSALLKSAGLVAGADCELVARMKSAGFVVVGTTTSPEFGISSSTESVAFGATHNPWGAGRSAGGSSGGSAAAVAAGAVPLALGSDGAGSLRMPAALCGVSALKPSHARISQAPDWEVMMGHNDNGAVARHVADLAAFLDLAEGGVAGDPAAFRFDERGSHQEAVAAIDRAPTLRVGLFTGESIGGVTIDAGVVAAVREAGRLLESAGHEVEEAWPAAYLEPELLDHFIDAIAPTLVDLIAGVEHTIGRTVDVRTELEPITRYWYERGAARTAGQLAADLRWLGGYRRRLCGWWADGWDVLVAPSFPSTTRPLGLVEDGGDLTRRNIDLVRATVPFNTSGQPAVTVPAFLSEDGPVGVQLVGAPGRDRTVLVAAAQIQALNGSATWMPASRSGS